MYKRQETTRYLTLPADLDLRITKYITDTHFR
jgi:hypothetical protein